METERGLVQGVRWLGESHHTLDDKNRVFVPRKLQGGLDRDGEGHLTAILTRGFEGCLFLFSESGFDTVLSRLTTQAFDGAELRKLQRLFFANTQRTTLDGSGRLLIPEKLKTLVGIDREVVLVGLVDRIELWPKPAWERFERENAGKFDALAEVLCAPRAPGPQS